MTENVYRKGIIYLHCIIGEYCIMINYEDYLKNLPVIPDIATKIMSIPEDAKNISFKELEDLIKLDPGLTTKILKVANSALYARQREIKTLQMAITLLGFKNIKSLIILTTASTLFTKQKQSTFYKDFWKHSVLTAFISKEIAKKEMQTVSKDESFLAGLLHDIGKVALYHVQTEQYQALLQQRAQTGESSSTLEKEYFGANHKEVGASILHGWNFPDIYVDTAREHGMENITSEHRSLILCVSIADIIADKISAPEVPERKAKTLERFLSLAGVHNDRLEYYNTTFIDQLIADPLFQECQDMFNFSYQPVQ